jgi:hypothetical protein
LYKLFLFFIALIIFLLPFLKYNLCILMLHILILL